MLHVVFYFSSTHFKNSVLFYRLSLDLCIFYILSKLLHCAKTCTLKKKAKQRTVKAIEVEGTFS